jgi:hypothetical protein
VSPQSCTTAQEEASGSTPAMTLRWPTTITAPAQMQRPLPRSLSRVVGCERRAESSALRRRALGPEVEASQLRRRQCRTPAGLQAPISRARICAIGAARDSAVGADRRHLGPASTPRADYCFDKDASTEAASTRCAFVARCGSTRPDGGGFCFRCGACPLVWLAGRLCVPERFAWLESHGAAQRDLHHQ